MAARGAFVSVPACVLWKGPVERCVRAAQGSPGGPGAGPGGPWPPRRWSPAIMGPSVVPFAHGVTGIGHVYGSAHGRPKKLFAYRANTRVQY